MKRAFANRWVRGIAAACIVLLYLPPIGQTIKLPDIEPFLEPGVPHAAPTFIHTGHHVYYRVRLHRPVAPWFASTYFQRLHARGVHVASMGTSAFGPAPERTGWLIGMTRERAVEPYTIEYWKSKDFESTWFPISLRWPWLYVRLGPQVALPPRPAVLTPPAVPLGLLPVLPPHLDAKLTSAQRIDRRIVFQFWAAASRADVSAHYKSAFEINERVRQVPGDYNLFLLSAPPLRTLGVRSIRLDISNYLYTDHPIVVYPYDQLPDKPFYDQQPEALVHLPRVSKFGIILFFVSEDAARKVWAHIAPGAHAP